MLRRLFGGSKHEAAGAGTPKTEKTGGADEKVISIQFRNHPILIAFKEAVIEKKDIKEVSQLLQVCLATDSPYLGGRDSVSNTVAHIAAHHKQAVELLEIILKTNKHFLDLPNDNGHTPLTIAASCGNVAAVDFLVKAGANVKHVTKSGKWIGDYALQSGKASLIPVLQAAGLKTEALEQAFKEQQDRALLKEIQDGTFLSVAAYKGDVAEVVALIKAGVDTKKGNVTQWAAVSHNTALIPVLQSAGLSFHEKDEKGTTGFDVAISQRNAMAKAAKEKSATAAEEKTCDLEQERDAYAAFAQALIPETEIVLETGSRVKPETARIKDPTSLLIDAAQRGRAETVKFLAEHGAHVNVQNKEGFTALHVATVRCHDTQQYDPTISALLEAGADPNIQAGDLTSGTGARTPIHMAAADGNKPAVELLLFRGRGVQARVDIVGCRGTALHEAAHHTAAEHKVEHEQVAECLLRAGANIDAVNPDGKTALIVAAEQGNVAMVRWFGEHRANVDATMRDGRRAVHIAAERGNVELLRALTAHSAKLDGGELIKIATREGHRAFAAEVQTMLKEREAALPGAMSMAVAPAKWSSMPGMAGRPAAPHPSAATPFRSTVSAAPTETKRQTAEKGADKPAQGAAGADTDTTPVKPAPAAPTPGIGFGAGARS